METRANYALIGGLVLIAAGVIAAFVLWLGQSEFQRDYKAYDIVFEGPVSLEEGAAVRYIGVKVGEVATVRIDKADPSKVRAHIRVARETPIKEDSTASIQLAGITGITFVQISAGTGKPLEGRPGLPVPIIRSERTLVDQIVAGGAQALGRANLTFDGINRMLTDENIASVTTSIKNLETITTRLASDDGLISEASATLKDVSAASNAFETASIDLQGFGKTAETSVAGAGEDIKTLVADFRTVANAATVTLEESRRAVSAATALMEGPAAATFENTTAASQDLRVLINRLDRAVREIERNPQGFIVGEPLPYEEKRR
ncbi:MAG: MCE family protein [Hyphomonas sp.]|uniref:MlaD family protein n=1 Tax=Hyphomonas sp. TaxID=87 RepID=UPI0018007772|nr:MlaD family protein [Hyphomonas sp.]MBA3069489.1 MCE family protein [Hyphomonas sp.]MBU4063871.1 MCE family protein [Alphaproteobacteria bacterium]MBU4164168.1 MCE family protein [Alphaproteobacteria bacterium]MBU4568270.1 MCE family protein [Alphaproteobacteria bacterium]